MYAVAVSSPVALVGGLKALPKPSKVRAGGPNLMNIHQWSTGDEMSVDWTVFTTHNKGKSPYLLNMRF
jgi:hypothetical protein